MEENRCRAEDRRQMPKKYEMKWEEERRMEKYYRRGQGRKWHDGGKKTKERMVESEQQERWWVSGHIPVMIYNGGVVVYGTPLKTLMACNNTSMWVLANRTPPSLSWILSSQMSWMLSSQMSWMLSSRMSWVLPSQMSWILSSQMSWMLSSRMSWVLSSQMSWKLPSQMSWVLSSRMSWVLSSQMSWILHVTELK